MWPAAADSGHDVNYLFGQVEVHRASIDWSGSCGNLASAVGPFALYEKMLPAGRATPAAVCGGRLMLRIWQVNVQQTIVAHVPVRVCADGGVSVQESGAFELDGVTFPAAEIPLEFLGGERVAALPTGRALDALQIPGLGEIQCTLITSGNPTVIVLASALGITGTELPPAFNADAALLARCETVRAAGARAMHLASPLMPSVPKIMLVSPRPSAPHTVGGGRTVPPDAVDMCARIVSMGRLHHAMTGTGCVALAAASAIPGTLVARLLEERPCDSSCAAVRIGHASGVVAVGGDAALDARTRVWHVTAVRLSRTARRLMVGLVSGGDMGTETGTASPMPRL